MDGIRVKLIDKKFRTYYATDPNRLSYVQIDAENLDDIRMEDSDELRLRMGHGSWESFFENLSIQ